MLKASFYALLATIFSLSFAGATRAASSEGETTARQGVVLCGGNNFSRLGGTEVHLTFWTLRNVDSTQPIIIDRMRFFDAHGVVLGDSAVSGGLPASDNGTLGPGNNTLNPHQAGQFSSNSILDSFLTETQRPGTLEIAWSSAKPALTLWVSATRASRERNPISGAIGVERGRHLRECRSIFLK